MTSLVNSLRCSWWVKRGLKARADLAPFLRLKAESRNYSSNTLPVLFEAIDIPFKIEVQSELLKVLVEVLPEFLLQTITAMDREESFKKMFRF